MVLEASDFLFPEDKKVRGFEDNVHGCDRSRAA
jgi:hypothetical protein